MESYSISGPCRRCGESISVDLPIWLDAVHDPARVQCVLSRKTMPWKCNLCGSDNPFTFGLPWVYWGDTWTGVVPHKSLPARSIFDQVRSHVTRSLQTAASVPPLIRVFGGFDDLAYDILHPGCTALRRRLADLLGSRCDDEILFLTGVCNALVEANEAGYAYALLATSVHELPDLYLYQSVREALALCAHAAPDNALAPLGNPRTPLEDLAAIGAALDGRIPTWPALADYTVVVDAPIDQRTGEPLEGSVSIVRQPESSLDCKCRVLMRGLVLGPVLKSRGASLPWRLAYAEASIRAMWSNLETADQEWLNSFHTDVLGQPFRVAT